MKLLIFCSLFSLLFFSFSFGKEEEEEISKGVEKFEIDVREEELFSLKNRIGLWKKNHVVGGVGWERGINSHYLAELVEYWKNDYDWKKQEKMLNTQLPQFTTTIRGLKIHFAHIPSQNKSALPLLFVHGWPGSFFEAIKVAPLLHDKFHLVAPSIPGYGFSEAPKKPGMEPKEVGEIFSELMSRLHYSSFLAQGGDWGSIITTYIAANDPNCIGVHLNMIPVLPPFVGKGFLATTYKILASIFPSLFYDKDPSAQLLKAFPEMGYLYEQATKPHTLGVALSDSPVGLLAWIVEKFYVWGDVHGDIESRFSKDTLLTNVMLYWLSNNIGSSIQLYYEFFNSAAILKKEFFSIEIHIPSAFALFPAELFQSPKQDVAYYFLDMCYWTEMESGGHFAALEEPELLADDILRFSENCLRKTSQKNEL